MRRAVLTSCAVAALLLGSARAHAHLATTGLGPIYDGISHFLLSIDDLLPVLAMTLLAGLNGPTSARWAVFVLPTAWFAGGMAGSHGGLTSAPAGITSLSMLLLGILVAADVRLRPLAVAALTRMAARWFEWRGHRDGGTGGERPDRHRRRGLRRWRIDDSSGHFAARTMGSHRRACRRELDGGNRAAAARMVAQRSWLNCDAAPHRSVRHRSSDADSNRVKTGKLGGLQKGPWRRERDSNPRRAVNPHTLSRRAT
jgi:hypothetical protein